MLDGAGCRAGRRAPLFRRGGRRAVRPVRPLPRPARGRPTPPRRRRRRSRPCTGWAAASAAAGSSTTCWARPRSRRAPRPALSTFGIGQRVQRRRLARPDRPAAVRGPAARGPQRRPAAGRPRRRRRGAGRLPRRAAGRACASAPRPQDAAARSAAPRKRRGGEPPAVEPPTQPLFEALRAWRRDEAAEQHVPPYVIFHDRTLAEIARRAARRAATRWRRSAASARASSTAMARRC